MAEAATLPLYQDRHFVRFLLPFSLRETVSPVRSGFWRRSAEPQDMLYQLVARLECAGQWQAQEKSSPEYILPHVEKFLFPEAAEPDESRYVFTYHLSNQALQQRVAAGGRCEFIVQTGTEECCYPMAFQEVHLYLFRSGVGILMFQVAMRPGIRRTAHAAASDKEPGGEDLPLDLEQLIQFNRAWRHMEHRGSSPYFRLRSRDHPAEYPTTAAQRRFTLNDLIDAFLAPIGEAGKAWEAFYERHLIGYAFALVSRQDHEGKPLPIPYDELKRPLFWLRRYFEPNYLPTEADLRLEDNPEVVQTFENIYFGVSLEGGVVLAWDSGNDFIRNQLHARVREGYFVLFLLALHQRLATIHLAYLIDQTSYHQHSHRPVQRSVARDIQYLRRRLFAFIIRCWFAEVSNMKMYAEVYRAWQRVFAVEALLGEVKNEVAELDDYLQRAQMERETRLINLLTWFFFPFLFVFAFWGMNFKDWEHIPATHPRIWLPSAGVVGLYYLVMVWYRRRRV